MGGVGVAKSIARLNEKWLRCVRTSRVEGITHRKRVGSAVGIGYVFQHAAIHTDQRSAVPRPGIGKGGSSASVIRITTVERDGQAVTRARIVCGAFYYGYDGTFLHQIRSDFGRLTPVLDFYPIVSRFGSIEGRACAGKFQNPVPIPAISPVAGKEWGDGERGRPTLTKLLRPADGAGRRRRHQANLHHIAVARIATRIWITLGAALDAVVNTGRGRRPICWISGVILRQGVGVLDGVAAAQVYPAGAGRRGYWRAKMILPHRVAVSEWGHHFKLRIVAGANLIFIRKPSRWSRTNRLRGNSHHVYQTAHGIRVNGNA